jgi:NTP-dependent ternary system trypsin peptidase co-occuring protein
MPNTSSSTDDQRIGLAEMIENLRSELEASLEKGVNRAVAFDIDKVDLELTVVIARKQEGKAGVAFWVVNAGGSVEAGRDITHTFNLTLLPVSGITGGRLKVGSHADVPPSQTEAPPGS